MLQLEGFEVDLGNTAVNDDNDCGVDITPHATATADDSKRSVGVRCRLGSLETSKPLTNQIRFERSVGSGVDSIENVKKENIKAIKRPEWLIL